MATRSSDYWERRFSTLENSLHREGLSCYAEIEQQYRRAEHEIETQMRSWYNRFAENNEISLADAKKWLRDKDLEEFKWTVQDYIKAGEENALDGRWMKELENASAKYHISRLESLELEMQQSLEVMFGNQLDSLDAAMRKVYTDGYYHTAFEIQKGWGVGWDFAQLDERKINNIIRKPWAADGKDFSERIWGNREKLVNELNQTLVQNMVLGQDPQKAINAIAQKMEVSKRNAGRLVMTEEAYFASVSQADCFRELDVEQYQIIVTFDKETCDTCGDMDGRVFKMSEREVGATAPPFHPNCRCTTIPYFDKWYGLEQERAARDENGQTYKVPADTTYNQWSGQFGENSLPEVNENAKVEETPKRIEFKTAETIEEAEEYAKNTLGFSQCDYDGMNLDVANVINEETTKTYNLFGNVNEAGYLNGVRKYPKRADWEAAYSPGWKEIWVKNVSSKNSLKNMQKDAVANNALGFWSTNKAEHAIRHELGHSVQHMLTDNDVDKLSKISSLRQDIMNKCGITKWSTKDTSDHMKAAGSYLSYYGLETDAEFIAESVAEYLSGDARDTATQVVNILLGK